MYALGKQAPRIDRRTLKLERYVDFAQLPPAPPARQWSALCGPQIGMMQNDVIGCCTAATFGHAIQVWTANHGREITVPDQAVLDLYASVSGYRPGDPSTDNGAVLLDVLKAMRTAGLPDRQGVVHQIGAFIALQPGNRQHVMAAINLFGGVVLGLSLPQSAQAQIGQTWRVPWYGAHGQGARGSWGGHAVFNPSYGPHGLTCATWGAWQLMTWQFARDYVDEAYAVLSPDWVAPGKAAPCGLDLAALQADLKLVTG